MALIKPFTFKIVLSLAAVVALASCASSSLFRSSKEEAPLVGWEEIVTSHATKFDRAVKIYLQRLVTNTPKSSLHPRIRRSKTLSHLAVERSMKNTMPYEKGVFGKVGVAKYFVATTDKIPDWTRLYWVQIKVLSEKFGCFMTRKYKRGNVMVAQCRDKRRIVLTRSKGDGWIQFFARQYDRQGYEIVVKKKRIVRISKYKVL